MDYLEKKQGKINLVELFSAAYEEILLSNEVDAGMSGSHAILQTVYIHVLQGKHCFLHMQVLKLPSTYFDLIQQDTLAN